MAARSAPDPDSHHESDRAVRAILGSGPSQVRRDQAIRARDANRPDEQELADAERELQIVRRHWQPPRR